MPSQKGHRDKEDRLFDEAVGRRLRAERMHRGLTQTQVAELAGIRFQQLGKYERGQDRVAASRLARLAKAIGVSAAQLLGESEDTVQPSAGPAAVRLAQDFNRCSPAGQRAVLDLVRSLIVRP